MLAEKLFEKIGYTEEMICAYGQYKQIYADRLEAIAKDKVFGGTPILDACKAAREVEPSVCEDTADLMLLLESTGYLLEKYRANGLPDEMFYNAMTDLRCKTQECLDYKKVFGNFVAYWYDGFFDLTRFAFGRLQYDVMEHAAEPVLLQDYWVQPGDLVLNCHIPMAGPLKPELCLDSFRQAYAYFRDKLKDGMMVVRCNSWLLMPEYLRVFREASGNIYAFVRNFHILESKQREKFADAWRVFHTSLEETSVDALPLDTGLQRSFVRYIKNGGVFGIGTGMLLFDGTQVLTRNRLD